MKPAPTISAREPSPRRDGTLQAAFPLQQLGVVGQQLGALGDGSRDDQSIGRVFVSVNKTDGNPGNFAVDRYLAQASCQQIAAPAPH
jgi:hypothetical protein